VLLPQRKPPEMESVLAEVYDEATATETPFKYKAHESSQAHWAEKDDTATSKTPNVVRNT
jgi:hypothetical protein